MARVGRRPRRDEDGFGLVEVMLSLSVLLVVLVATSYLVDNVVQQAATSRQKVAATELAEQWLEQLSNDPISSLQAYIAKDVQLTATARRRGRHRLHGVGTPGVGRHRRHPQSVHLRKPAPGDPGHRHGEVGHGQSLGETTIINPPYGTVVPGDGFLSIQIYGLNAPNPPADTANLINVAVTVMPSTTLTTG